MRFIILFLIFTNNILAEEIIGKPKIIDGDTIHIAKYKIRLEGIDAPRNETKMQKRRLKISSTIGFTFYEDYYCGKISKKILRLKLMDQRLNVFLLPKIDIKDI